MHTIVEIIIELYKFFPLPFVKRQEGRKGKKTGSMFQLTARHKLHGLNKLLRCHGCLIFENGISKR